MNHTKSFVSSPWVTFNIPGEWEGLTITRKGSVPGDTNPANCLSMPSRDGGQGIRAVQRWGGQAEKLGSGQEANLQRGSAFLLKGIYAVLMRETRPI